MDDALLIDQWLPGYDFRESHEIRVRAPAATALRAVRELDLARSPVVRLLFRLRGMPGSTLTVRGMEEKGFVVLDEAPDREFVLGLIGRFWTPGGDLQSFAPDEFTRHDTPGYARAAWNFRVEPAPGGCRLGTETRIACNDPRSRRKFAIYWFVVRPFSGLIRREMLRLARGSAEGDR